LSTAVDTPKKQAFAVDAVVVLLSLYVGCLAGQANENQEQKRGRGGERSLKKRGFSDVKLSKLFVNGRVDPC